MTNRVLLVRLFTEEALERFKSDQGFALISPLAKRPNADLTLNPVDHKPLEPALFHGVAALMSPAQAKTAADVWLDALKTLSDDANINKSAAVVRVPVKNLSAEFVAAMSTPAAVNAFRRLTHLAETLVAELDGDGDEEGEDSAMSSSGGGPSLKRALLLYAGVLRPGNKHFKRRR